MHEVAETVKDLSHSMAPPIDGLLGQHDELSPLDILDILDYLLLSLTKIKRLSFVLWISLFEKNGCSRGWWRSDHSTHRFFLSPFHPFKVAVPVTVPNEYIKLFHDFVVPLGGQSTSPEQSHHGEYQPSVSL